MDILEILDRYAEGDEFQRPIETAIEEITKLREQVAAQAAEIACLKTVPMKYRRMQFNAELQEEVARLREQVAAQTAVIEKLTKRLASTNIIIEVVCAIHPDSACAKYELAENMNALSIPTGSTQILEQYVKEKTQAQAAVIEKLREALIAGWSLQCDFDDARQLADEALALSTDSTQILAEVRRAERERVAQMFEESGIGGDHLAAAIRAME